MQSLHAAALINHRGAALMAAGEFTAAFDAFLLSSNTIKMVTMSPEYEAPTATTRLRARCFTDKQYLHGIKLHPDIVPNIGPSDHGREVWVRTSYSLQSYASTNSSCISGNIYEHALIFYVSNGTSDEQHYGPLNEQPCQLFLAATTFNMAIALHLQSLRSNENCQAVLRIVSQHLYDSAIDIVSLAWNPANDTETNMEAACILVVALNNKATLSFALGNYIVCESVRSILVIVLNSMVKQLELPAFLDGTDILAFYHNALLLASPMTSPAA